MTRSPVWRFFPRGLREPIPLWEARPSRERADREGTIPRRFASRHPRPSP